MPNESVKQDNKKLEDVMKTISKKYGENSLLLLSDKNLKNVETISTGLPSLDLILGGGLGKGRIIEIYGPESGGKTTLSLQIIANFQKEYPDKKIAFIDIENTFDPKYASNIGVNVNDLLFNQPNSGEEAQDIIEKLAQTGAVSLIVLDSVAQLVPQAVANKEIGDSANIGTTARLLSQSLPRISNAISRSKTTLIYTNQIRMKIGVMWGSPEVTTGGVALKFAASQRIEVRGQKAEARGGKEGIPVKVKIRKNKIAPPFMETELFIRFGEGFDKIGDLIETAMAVGVMQKAGAWSIYDKIKVQGTEAMREELEKDLKLQYKVLKEVKAKIAEQIKK